MGKQIKKVPPGMKKLSPEKKTEKADKPYTWDPRPSICVKKEDLPQMEDWEAGKEYVLVVRVKMEGYHSDLNSDGKQEARGDFRIVAIGVEEKE